MARREAAILTGAGAAGMESPQKPKKKLVGGIGVAVITAILSGVMLEAVLRGCAPLHMAGNREAYRYDEELGCRLRENLHLLRTTDYQEEIYTNAEGLANFQGDLRNYKVLIFAVGDSFTQGTGLPADASYPFQLDLLLNLDNGRYEPRYGVVNLGVATYGGQQNLRALKRHREKLGRPGYILYLGCSNDYADDLLFADGHAHNRMVAGNPKWPWYTRPLAWWAHETEVGKRVKIAAGNLKRRRLFSRDQALSPSPAGAPKAAAELEEPVFQELIELSRGFGAKLILSWADLPSAGDNSYAWLQEFAEKQRIAFADWQPAVASVHTSMPALPLTNPHTGGHYRTWVNGQIARAYAEQILSPRR